GATKLERRTTFEPAPSPSPSPSPRLAAPQPAKNEIKNEVKSEPAPAASPSAEPARREAHDQAAAPDAAFAKAPDSDLKTRDAGTKRSERRHAQRRQQWADRRRMQRSPDPDRRDVEQEAREDTGPRRVVEEQEQEQEQEPVVTELPRIRLFDGF